MRDEHIINLIEHTPLADLSEADLDRIRVHAGACSECLSAFQAAKVSLLLLKERAAVEFEPSPFFHTRVLATLRERQARNESWALGRMWRSAGALASSMAAAVVLLAVFTFVVPENQVASQQVSSLANSYSAEEVILDQTFPLEEVSDGQMLTTIYGGDEEPSK
jgi:anti-sigma-K factor RskA